MFLHAKYEIIQHDISSINLFRYLLVFTNNRVI